MCGVNSYQCVIRSSRTLHIVKSLLAALTSMNSSPKCEVLFEELIRRHKCGEFLD
jgi:hypothetical protein